MIEKKLNVIGNSWCVIIPRDILNSLGLDPTKDKIELSIEKDELRIRKKKKYRK